MDIQYKEIKKRYINCFDVKMKSLGFSKKGGLWYKKGDDFYQYVGFEILRKRFISLDFAISIQNQKINKITEAELYRDDVGLLNAEERKYYIENLVNLNKEEDQIDKQVSKLVEFLISKEVFKKLSLLSNKKKLEEYLRDYDINHFLFTRHYSSMQLLVMLSPP